MINISSIKKKSASLNTEMVGVRIDEDTKQWLDNFCRERSIPVTSLVLELIKQFRKEHHGP